MTGKGHLYAKAAAMNAKLKRDDIEWFVNHRDEIELRDKPAWSERRTHQMARKREAERQAWLRNHREGQFSDPHRQPAEDTLDFLS